MTHDYVHHRRVQDIVQLAVKLTHESGMEGGFQSSLHQSFGTACVAYW